MNTIFLIRHAENVANLTKEFSCRKVDYSLTAKGMLQAQQTAEYLSRRGITHLFSSPLKRARETAEIISARIGLPVTVIEDLRELNVGDLEGLPPTAELWAQHDAIVRAWRTGRPGERFPGGEDYHELLARARAALEEILAASGGRAARIALVIHGGWMSFTLFDLFPGLDPASFDLTGLHNCSVTELELEPAAAPQRARMVFFGGHAHLSGEAAKLVPGSPRKGELPSTGGQTAC